MKNIDKSKVPFYFKFIIRDDEIEVKRHFTVCRCFQSHVGKFRFSYENPFSIVGLVDSIHVLLINLNENACAHKLFEFQFSCEARLPSPDFWKREGRYMFPNC